MVEPKRRSKRKVAVEEPPPPEAPPPTTPALPSVQMTPGGMSYLYDGLTNQHQRLKMEMRELYRRFIRAGAGNELKQTIVSDPPLPMLADELDGVMLLMTLEDKAANQSQQSATPPDGAGIGC